MPTVPAGRAGAPGAAGQVAGSPARVSVSDGAGGIYIAWAETDRDNTDPDIVLLRVTSTGAVAAGWPAQGLALCDLPGAQSQPMLVSDGSDGVIVAWLDGRAGVQVFDAYAQRVDASGVSQWTANGVEFRHHMLFSGGGPMDIAPDGGGGLVCAWSAPGASDFDVFATRITGAGTLAPGWSLAGVPVCTAAGDQTNPAIVGDGAGGAYVAWSDGRNGDYSWNIFAQRLSAAGVPQWTADGIQLDLVNTTAGGPKVCSDGDSGAIVFWTGTDGLTFEPVVLGQKLNGVGAGQWAAGGATVLAWSGLTRLETCASEGPDGAIVVATGGSPQAVRAQRVSGVGAPLWGASGTQVTATPSFLTFRQIVPDGAGAAYFVWEDYRNFSSPSGVPEIFAQRVEAGGGVAWATDGVGVSEGHGITEFPEAALDGSGGLMVAWRRILRGPEGIFAQRFSAASAALLGPGGASVFPDPGRQRNSSAIQTSEGGAFVLYREVEAGQWVDRARKFHPDGTPAGSSINMCTAAVLPEVIGSVEDGSGGFIYAWLDRRSGSFGVYAQRFDANLAPQWDPSGVLIHVAADIQEPGSIVRDGAGGAIILWSDPRGYPYTQLIAQRVNATGALQWAPDGVAVCTALEFTRSLLAVSDGAGGVIAAWQDSRNPGETDIYAQRLSSSGAPQWAVNGVPVASGDGISNAPYEGLTGITPGLANDAILLFKRGAIDSSAIGLVSLPIVHTLFAQKVNASGAVLWGPSGVVVCDANSPIVTSKLVDDGAGGAFVAWTDERAGTIDLYMQRLDAAGASQWTGNGLAVCDASGWEFLQDLTRDPAGEAYVSWWDTRSGYPDVYAQRVNGLGVPQWAANGRLICGESRGQYLSSFAPFKAASPARLFITWTDNRTGDARDVYLDRLDLSGASQWVPNGITSTTLSLASAAATPAGVKLIWQASENVSVTVYRRTADRAWQRLASAYPDGTGRISFEDPEVEPGTRYGYRLGYPDRGGEAYAGEVWIDVPGEFELSLSGLLPNPATRELVISFTLPGIAPTTLELLDLSGRRILHRDLTGLSAGRHTLSLGDEVPPAGVYFVRLTYGGRSMVTRATLLR